MGPVARSLASILPAKGWVDDTAPGFLPDANDKRHRPRTRDAAPSENRGEAAPGELEDAVHDLLDAEPR